MRSILNPWPWKMAWRDSRSSRGQLLLFAASIVLGVAALVAISGFRANLKSALDLQAKSLLGADLLLSGRQPLTGEAEALVDGLGGAQAREVRFSSMVHFPASDGSRLAQVRAGETTFPFYGTVEVEPPRAPDQLDQGPFALVEASLMDQFQARLGDAVRIGNRSFRIAGRLRQMPGEFLGSNLVGGRVYIPLAYLEETGLLGWGSTASYRVYFKFDDRVDLRALLQGIRPQLLEHRLRAETVAERKARLGRILENSADFLNLVGFIALLLGGLGVASSVHVYVKRKVPTAALLRCLGAKPPQTLSIYLCQALGMSLAGILGGILLGVGLQYFLPGVLRDFLPVAIPFSLSWSALAGAGLIGLVLAWLFSIQPLLFVRRVSPLAALRMDYEAGRPPFDWAPWLVRLAIVAAILGFALVHTRRWMDAVGFALGLLISLALLAAAARLGMVLIRKFFPGSWPYPWRQGLANLHRPHNQTVVLVLSIGFATFLMMLLYLVHQGLLGQILRAAGSGQPDMVLFDVQGDQKAELADLLQGFGAPVLQDV
ncbi:MAG: ABC transporter permease, partial [Acidobacteriota bacterium]|nr:ABC transporter permease [Acidobacteriota bacterium]